MLCSFGNQHVSGKMFGHKNLTSKIKLTCTADPS